MKSLAAHLLVCLLCTLLAACGQSRVVRRYDHAVPVRQASAGDYTVRSGDTLYGIAFRHDLDFRDLAAWNRISPPYTIYPGQRLRLRVPTAMRPAPATRMAPSRPVTTPARTANPPPVTTPRRESSPPVTAAPVTAVPERRAVTAPPVTTAPPAVSKPGVSTAPAQTSGQWVWPTSGQIIGRYVAGDPTRQGIDVAGSAGQPVLASADGVVVYSGTGLVGYGEVIIVKHSDEWLSAYGHNRRRLVAEGETVKGGQTIAELGRSGTSRDMLHFEIRRNGKPVDPLSLLPPGRSPSAAQAMDGR